MEPLGLLFALVASSLWIVTSLYSIGYMRGHHEKNQTRFYFFFAVAISSAMGVAFAGNLFTLFFFYEVLTLCTFPLVTHHQTPEAEEGREGLSGNPPDHIHWAPAPGHHLDLFPGGHSGLSTGRDPGGHWHLSGMVRRPPGPLSCSGSGRPR